MIFVGDSTAPPNYDTAYITTYKQHLTLSAVSSCRLASFDIMDTLQHAVTWSTNNVTQYGAALDIRFALGYRFGRSYIRGLEKVGL